jgi:ribonuclease BN (tRNA processing enzyme)
MRVRVLGCSGGIGGSLRTTSLLLDHDILVDAGTGVGDLTLAQLAQIDHVFVTHSHLDHVGSIPFILDSVGWMRREPLIVHATEGTIQILREHLFNWKLWPDFTQIPDPVKPMLRYETMDIGSQVELRGRRLTALPANHVVPAAGYRLDSGAASFVFTGDTTTNGALWPLVNAMTNLRYLVIETAFSNHDKELAIASKHLCPSLLAEELRQLTRPAEIYITHLKPGEGELIMQEITACAGEWAPRMLTGGQVFEF